VEGSKLRRIWTHSFNTPSRVRRLCDLALLTCRRTSAVDGGGIFFVGRLRHNAPYFGGRLSIIYDDWIAGGHERCSVLCYLYFVIAADLSKHAHVSVCSRGACSFRSLQTSSGCPFPIYSWGVCMYALNSSGRKIPISCFSNNLYIASGLSFFPLLRSFVSFLFLAFSQL